MSHNSAANLYWTPMVKHPLFSLMTDVLFRSRNPLAIGRILPASIIRRTLYGFRHSGGKNPIKRHCIFWNWSSWVYIMYVGLINLKDGEKIKSKDIVHFEIDPHGFTLCMLVWSIWKIWNKIGYFLTLIWMIIKHLNNIWITFY